MQFTVHDPLNFQEDDIFAERYRIVGEIGRGGMGRVFRAVDLELDVEIAIKIIRPELLDDELMVKRFKNEILLAREVSHENVVRIHDFSEWRSIKFITMQYIDGVTLRSRINQQGPLALEEIESLAIQVCRGLEAARRKGIAHRDLKPQNILIDCEGHVFIVDFGLAKGMRQSGASVSGVIMGTPEYISPEQWKGQRGDFRSDIYSLGVILYEMITAKPLFHADTDLGYLQKHLSETPAFGTADKQRIPDYLRRIILRCLAKNPDMRYQNAAEVEADIQAQRAPIISLRYKMNRWLRKRVLPLLTLLILVVVLWSVLHQHSRPDEMEDGRRRLIVLPFANNTGEERYAFWSRGLADLLTTDLGQSRHIRVTGDGLLQTFFNRYPDWTPREQLYREQLELLRQESGADFVMIGELTQAGSRFRVSARIVSLQSGEYRESIQSDGIGEDSIFSMINSLTDKTKLAFKLPREVILKEIDKDIRQISTSSIEALRAYSTGKEFFQRGRFQEAAAQFEKAVASDSDFAMAYAFAAMAMGKYDDPRKKQFFERALSLAGHMTERERLALEGKYQNSVRGDYRKALDCFRKILLDYPDDVEALEEAASVSRNMENWAESNRFYRELEKLNPGRAIVSTNLFTNELEQGHFSATRDIIERYQSGLKKSKHYHLLRYHMFFLQGLIDDAETELNLSREESGNIPHFNGMLGNLMVLRDRLDDAQELYRRVWDGLATPRQRYRIVGSLTNLCLHRGRFGEALSWIDRLNQEATAAGNGDLLKNLAFDRLNICVFHPEAAVREDAFSKLSTILAGEKQEHHFLRRFELLYAVGRLNVQRRDWKGLEENLLEMDGVVEIIGRPFMRYPLHLRSLAALARGELTQAENYYHQAWKLFPDPQRPGGIPDFNLTLPRIKAGAGEDEEAMALYESGIANHLGRLENAAVFIMAHAELAGLQAKTGRIDAARRTAARVIEWWDGGDYAPQVVEEMRTIVARN